VLWAIILMEDVILCRWANLDDERHRRGCYGQQLRQPKITGDGTDSDVIDDTRFAGEGVMG
jgi:hypothetical protein